MASTRNRKRIGGKEKRLKRIDRRGNFRILVKDTSRIESGIPEFDRIVGGGIPASSLTLLSGTCGTGKSTFALQFLCWGATKGEPGLYITLEDEPIEIINKAKRICKAASRLIQENKLVVVKPEVYRFDVLKEIIEDHTERYGVKRIVIDPFSLITAYFENVYDIRKALSDIRRQIKSLKITLLAITDIKEGAHGFSSTGFEEFVADGVIVFSLTEKKESGTFVRTIFVRKMTESKHEIRLIPMEITEKGIEIYPDAEVF
ncbi:MAG: ATPase domain-containing protein [Candidatus Anstonellales archaeon]